jgi:hypothetical protein
MMYENGSCKSATVPSVVVEKKEMVLQDHAALVQEKEEPYQIFVRLYDQSIVTVNNPKTLEDIEQYVEKRVGLNKNEQIYSINGKPLHKKLRYRYNNNNNDGGDDDSNTMITLKEQNVFNKSTIDLNLRLNGGMDGMAIFTIAIVAGIIIYAIYKAVKALVNFSKWSWKICLRAPTCWCCKNVTLPVCDCGRAIVYTTKESCLATCDCCAVYYNPWQKMDVV